MQHVAEHTHLANNLIVFLSFNKKIIKFFFSVINRHLYNKDPRFIYSPILHSSQEECI